VWSRPLFTLLYAVPAQAGYLAAKLFTVAILLASAWQTWRLAEDLGFARAHLAAPLLLVQPSVMLLLSETLTEPLFALVFVIALRLHHRGRVVAGMTAASLLILARPEGFFIGVLWGVWVLADRRVAWPWPKRLASTLLLASGAALWWLAAWAITGDPLYIIHKWPPDWEPGRSYGSGKAWSYALSLPEIAGPILMIPFVVGLSRLLTGRRHGTLSWPFLTVFVLHSALWSLGTLGSAGYARYLVCVAPAIALVTLEGWNAVAERLPRGRTAAAAAVLAVSGAFGVAYVDGHVWARDAWAIDEMAAWWRANPRPVTRLVWSQAYMCAALDGDPMGEEPSLESLRKAPGGTLVFWDADTGPSWFKMTADDIERAGYVRLRSRKHELRGLVMGGGWRGKGGPRAQEMHLLYKE